MLCIPRNPRNPKKGRRLLKSIQKVRNLSSGILLKKTSVSRNTFPILNMLSKLNMFAYFNKFVDTFG